MRSVLMVSCVAATLCFGTASAESDIPTEWLTPAEIADFRSTPDYDETLAFIRRLSEKWDRIQLSFFGRSAAGRAMPLVVVSKDGFTPGTIGDDRARVLVQNGIHAGEIDGKDASLMILRDLALGRHHELLDGIVLLIVPIYNVDGHERTSRFNRPNQNGPEEGMGFRTTADGRDLNRDHLKLVTPEARHAIALFNRWQPHLHVDNHVTDGVDQDWLLTYSWVEAPQVPPPIDAWLKSEMPSVLEETAGLGHPIGPYVSLVEGTDPLQGIDTSVQEPRYATGYYPLRNCPSLLVENHSLKPYRSRVLANRDFMLALFRRIARDPRALIAAVAASGHYTTNLGRKDAKPSNVVLRYRRAETDETVHLPIHEWYVAESTVTGAPMLQYQESTKETEIPWYHRTEPEVSLARPRGYLVLPGWPVIEQRLVDHDVRFHRLERAQRLDVETIRISNPQGPRSRTSYQGLTRIAVDVERRTETRELPSGTIWIPADQPNFEVAVQLLEPEAPDSLVSWGMLSQTMEWKEHIEGRVLEKLARKMLEEDDALAREWKQALEDEAFAGDTFARYAWWYQRTPYWDETVGLMPVMRLMTAPTF